MDNGSYDDIGNLREYYIKICHNIAYAQKRKAIIELNQLLRVLFAIEVINEYEESQHRGEIIHPKEEYINEQLEKIKNEPMEFEEKN